MKKLEKHEWIFVMGLVDTYDYMNHTYYKLKSEDDKLTTKDWAEDFVKIRVILKT